MKKSLVAIALAFTFLILSCGDDNKGENAVPLGSQPGWDKEKIAAIGCRPTDSKFCECAIPKITCKYKPEELQTPSTFVQADITKIMAECQAQSSNASNPVGSKPAPASPVSSQGAYQMSTESCTTGTHKYQSLEQFCGMLQSSSLNNNCALESRIEKFKENCPGTFQELP